MIKDNTLKKFSLTAVMFQQGTMHAIEYGFLDFRALDKLLPGILEMMYTRPELQDEFINGFTAAKRKKQIMNSVEHPTMTVPENLYSI